MEVRFFMADAESVLHLLYSFPNSTFFVHFRVQLATLSAVREIQSVVSGHSIQTRHRGNLRTHRHRLTLSHTEMSSVGVRYFNRHSL